MTEEINAIENLFSEYEALDPNFKVNTYEHEFAKNIIESLISDDIDKFSLSVEKYDKSCRLETEQVSILLKCKKLFSQNNDSFSPNENENEDVK